MHSDYCGSLNFPNYEVNKTKGKIKKTSLVLPCSFCCEVLEMVINKRDNHTNKDMGSPL